MALFMRMGHLISIYRQYRVVEVNSFMSCSKLVCIEQPRKKIFIKLNKCLSFDFLSPRCHFCVGFFSVCAAGHFYVGCVKKHVSLLTQSIRI